MFKYTIEDNYVFPLFSYVVAEEVEIAQAISATEGSSQTITIEQHIPVFIVHPDDAKEDYKNNLKSIIDDHDAEFKTFIENKNYFTPFTIYNNFVDHNYIKAYSYKGIIALAAFAYTTALHSLLSNHSSSLKKADKIQLVYNENAFDGAEQSPFNAKIYELYDKAIAEANSHNTPEDIINSINNYLLTDDNTVIATAFYAQTFTRAATFYPYFLSQFINVVPTYITASFSNTAINGDFPDFISIDTDINTTSTTFTLSINANDPYEFVSANGSYSVVDGTRYALNTLLQGKQIQFSIPVGITSGFLSIGIKYNI